MRPRRLLPFLVALIALAVRPAAAQDLEHFILRASPADVDAVANRHGLTVSRVLRDGPNQILIVAGPAGATVDALTDELATDQAVVGFEADRRVRVAELASAPTLSQSTAVILEAAADASPMAFFGTTVPDFYALQTAATLIRLQAVRSTATGTGTIVAVIDTGVDATHPLLAGSVVPGYDFTQNVAGIATDATDLSQSTAVILEGSGGLAAQTRVATLSQSTAVILEQSTAVILEGNPLPAAFGHGTMVAGLVHLIAPGAKIMPLKAFRADGTSTVSDIVRAIYYAVDNGARVINMSFSMADSSEELMRAVDYATQHNVICVAAVGNQGREMVVYPAGYRNVIGVAASSNVDVRSTFSNFGDASISITAPGEMLFTTYPGNHYAMASGTSFSTALASGAVALLFQVAPAELVSQVPTDLARGPKIGQGLGEVRIDLAQTLQKVLARLK